MTTVGAFVVTRNRRSLVGEAIQSVIDQTVAPVAVWVVDNGCTDGTEDTISASFGNRVHYHKVGSNTGSAGGMHTAIRLALEYGYDWAWILDDDARADPDCLELLLRECDKERYVCAAVPVKRTGRNDIVESLVIWDPHLNRPKKPSPEQYGGESFDVDYSGTCGLLIGRLGIEKAGLPLRDLFYGFEDYEYCYRLRRWGRIIAVPPAIVRHPAHPESTPDTSFWKRYYAIRNVLYLRLYATQSVFPNTRVVGILALALRDCFDALSRPRGKIEKVCLVLAGVRDGLLGRIGAGPGWVRP